MDGCGIQCGQLDIGLVVGYVGAIEEHSVYGAGVLCAFGDCAYASIGNVGPCSDDLSGLGICVGTVGRNGGLIHSE